MTIFLRGLIGAFLVVGLTGTVQAAKYKTMKVANGGKITGKVAAGAAKAEAKSFTISKDPKICGEGNREVPLVLIKNGVVLNSVVYLDKVKQGKAFPAKLKSITINQAKCDFQPAFQVMANRGSLTAINADHTLHNIHTYELIGRARRTVLNVSQPQAGDKVTKKIRLRRGVGMKIECDAHDFMHAFVFVAPNPYFAVVKADGTFEIGDVPAGKYKIKLWHGHLGTKDGGEVTVSAGGAAKVNLKF